jgi:hypothetical protein
VGKDISGGLREIATPPLLPHEKIWFVMHRNKVVIDTNIRLYVVAGVSSAVEYLTQLLEQQDTDIFTQL